MAAYLEPQNDFVADSVLGPGETAVTKATESSLIVVWTLKGPGCFWTSYQTKSPLI